LTLSCPQPSSFPSGARSLFCGAPKRLPAAGFLHFSLIFRRDDAFRFFPAERSKALRVRLHHSCLSHPASADELQRFGFKGSGFDDGHHLLAGRLFAFRFHGDQSSIEGLVSELHSECVLFHSGVILTQAVTLSIGNFKDGEQWHAGNRR
jgi:hypothetical protein